jgi:hypothetical protein
MTKEEVLELREKKEEIIKEAAIAFNKAYREGKVKKLVNGEWIPVIPGENNADA